MNQLERTNESPRQLVKAMVFSPNGDVLYKDDKAYHRQLAKQLTPKTLTKKQRKGVYGPNASTMKSMKCTGVIQYSDGSVYHGEDARYMDMRVQGLGFQKMSTGIPYVKISSGG